MAKARASTRARIWLKRISLWVFIIITATAKYEAALAEFQRAIELQPNNAQALEFIAYVIAGRGNGSARWMSSSIDRARPARSIAGIRRRLIVFCACGKKSKPRHGCSHDRRHEATSMRMLLLALFKPERGEQEPLGCSRNSRPTICSRLTAGNVDNVIGTRAETFVLGRDFDAALKAWQTSPTQPSTKAATRGQTTVRFLAGDVTGARADAK